MNSNHFNSFFFLKKKTKPLTVFLHIPKTGGTTIRTHMIRTSSEIKILSLYSDFIDNANPNHYLSNMSSEDRRDIDIIFGHFLNIRNIKKLFPDRQINLITFVREPAMRIISMYNHNRRCYANGIKKYSGVLAKNGSYLSFEDWFDINMKKAIFNYNMLYIKWYLNIGFPKYLRYNKQSQYIYCKIAKNILDNFQFVGITEQPEDYSICYNLMGISTCHLKKENVCQKSYVDLSASKLENMKEYIRNSIPYSREFYEYAKKINIQKKEELGLR